MSDFSVVTSTVSSKTLASMASKRGCCFHESLKGLKCPNKTAVDLANDGKFVFLKYEEAIGLNITRNIVQGMDGIYAAALFYEMAAISYASRITLTGRLSELRHECRVPLTNNSYLRSLPESPSTKTIS